ncbi:MAG: inositol monophosphatase [Dehalococcoidia bacterium]|nr:inositol monophosphatase [Dehalococcoidia bacterium]
MSDPTATPAALLPLARAIAREAGALILDAIEGERAVEAKTSPTDLVSEMDRASEALIVRRILEARPRDGILGEEGAVRPGSTGVRWVIDPIDGTTNYLHRIPHFAVSIGVELNDITVAGVVFNPAVDELVAGSLGGGATLNGVPIRPSEEARTGSALVGTGFGYDAGVREQQAAVVVQHVLPRVADIRRSGSAALDLCWVACGRLDAYFERGIQPWDICAADLIVREAGGRSETLEGGPLTLSTTWIAAGAALFPAFRALIEHATRAP